MHKKIAALYWLFRIALGLLLLPIGFSYAQMSPGASPPSFADLAEKLLPAVVNIVSIEDPDTQSAEGEQDFTFNFLNRQNGGDEESNINAMGTGFIIDAEGYIVTNYHVISDAGHILVRFFDDREYPATLIGTDEKTDLTLLKIDTDEEIPYLPWGDSDKARIGDWVMAIGNPFGLGGTVTIGVVSAFQRDIDSGPYDDFIQTDAAINTGNSGGPLFNMQGEVIGINSEILSPSGGNIGIGFSIPSALARPLIQQLREKGRVTRGWLGVNIQPLPKSKAEALKLKRGEGVLVSGLIKGSPAEKAGIIKDDIILEFNGQALTRSKKLPRIVAESPLNKPLSVSLLRNGKPLHLELTLVEQLESEVAPPSSNEPKLTETDLAPIGISIVDLNPELRKQHRIDDTVKGVLVTAVKAMPSGTEKLRRGDVLVEIDQQPVTSAQDAAKRINTAGTMGTSNVTLLIWRDGDYKWIAVRLQ